MMKKLGWPEASKAGRATHLGAEPGTGQGQQERPKTQKNLPRTQKNLPKAPEPLIVLDQGRSPGDKGAELQKDNPWWTHGVVWGAQREHW